MLLINNEWACGICKRQADGGAVGRTGRLLWFCDQCGVDRAKDAFRMNNEFLFYEKQAIEAMQKELMEGDLIIPEKEVGTFLEWLIEKFGDKIREELDRGKPPF